MMVEVESSSDGRSGDQIIRYRLKNEPFQSGFHQHILPNLYLREDILSLQAEFPEAVISYDPIELANKLQTNHPCNNETNEDKLSLLIYKLNRQVISYFSSLFHFLSPVLLAYSQYKSTGYPWTIGYMPPSEIVILAVRWLEVSPPTVSVGGVSSLINLDLDDTTIDPSLPDFDSSVPTPSETSPSFTEWRRWPLTYLDPYPQWRVLATFENQFVGIGYSNGAVEVIDLIEKDNPRIFIQQPRELDFAPITGMSFVQNFSHLLVCRFSGEIELWHLKQKSVGFSARLVCQKLLNFPILSCVFDSENSFIAIGSEYVGTPGGHISIFSVSTLSSISEIVPRDSIYSGANTSCSPSKFRSLMRSIYPRKDSNLEDGFACLSLSPDGNLLCALHCSRAISIWSFPACSLLSTIISDAVALNSATITCKPLSPLLNSGVSVPLHLNWWRRDSGDPLLAILKSDGSLSVIDIESMENQLFSMDHHHQNGGHIQFAPFASFAITNVTGNVKAELFLLNCSTGNLTKREKRVHIDNHASRSYLGRIAAVLGITSKPSPLNDTVETADETESTFMEANVVRIAATTQLELFTHHLRSCRFSDALSLTSEGNVKVDGVKLDPESVYQYQLLALFHFPLKPTTFERIADVCFRNITGRVNWLVRECLHQIPCINDSWKTIDLFRATKLLLKEGLARSSNTNITALFEERLYHLDVLTSIYAEENALSLSQEMDDVHAENETKKWLSEIQIYRQNTPLDIGLWYLHTQRYVAFGVLLSHYSLTLTPHLIALLSTIPATEAPSKYLRPIKFFSESTVEQSPSSRLLRSLNEESLRRLYSLLPKDFRWANSIPNIVNLSQWACTRAYELDRLSGLITAAADLLSVVTEVIKSSADDNKSSAKYSRPKRRALFLLKKHSDEVEQMATTLYRAAPGYGFSNTLRRKIDLNGQLINLNSLKLMDYHQLSSEQRIELLIRVCIAAPTKATAAEVCGALVDRFLPFVASYEKSAIDLRLKWCLLRVANYATAGFEAISMLTERWKAADIEVVALLEDLSFESCVADFLLEFTPASSDDTGVYLLHVRKILSCINAEREEGNSRLHRMWQCCAALLDYHLLVSELGYVVPPRGVPTSMGEALSIGSGDEARLKQLVSRWIRTTIVAQGGELKHNETSRGVATSSLKAMKRLYFYNRLSTNFEDTSPTPLEVDDSEGKTLLSTFQRLCGILTRLLGVNSNEKARYHLLVGLLCSGDRNFIDFARHNLVQEPQSDLTWKAALQYAIGVYYDSTPIFGIGEVNEELGDFCLSLLPSPEDSPEFSFHGAVKFLSGISRLTGQAYSLLLSRSTWLKMTSDKKAELFVTALQDLLDLPYLKEVNLLQAGKYFGLTDVEVNRCFLKAALQAASKKSLSSTVIEETVALMHRILSIPEPSGWRELRLWNRAPFEILASLFPGVEDSVIKRFRLTLARFVITHSIRDAGYSEYADICAEFALICASQKSSSMVPENLPSMTQRLFSALSSTRQSVMIEPKPYNLCSFYLSPLDASELEDCPLPSASQSALMLAFLSNWTSEELRIKTVREAWIDGCVTAESLDVGLSYAFGPPLGQRPRNWTKIICTRLSEAIKGDDRKMEDYRLIVASVSASPPPEANSKSVFPSTRTLVEVLTRLSSKHSRIASWRSKALVNILVANPEKFLTDAAYRRSELLTISQTQPDISLLLAKHVEESRSQLVLSNLSEIVFSSKDSDPVIIKQRLKDISPYLKRDVPTDDLITYIQEAVDPRVEDIPHWRLLLLLKVLLAVIGNEDLTVSIRGLSIRKHLELLRTVVQLETPVYLTFLSALKKTSSKDFLSAVQPYLTSKSDVASLISLMRLSDSSPDVSDAEVYATYATHLLISSKCPIEDCMECFDLMITPPGDASVLANWISKNIFGRGEEAIGNQSMTPQERMELVKSAVNVAKNKSTGTASVERLKHFEMDLQRRITWLEDTADQSFLSKSLQLDILVHNFEDVDTASSILLQATEEYISTSSTDSAESFSHLLASFIAFIEHVTSLLYVDFQIAIAKTLCEAINAFLVTKIADWIYLDPLSLNDLLDADQVIKGFVKSAPMDHQCLVISLLLSWTAPRQLFGRVLLEFDSLSDNRLSVAQNAVIQMLSFSDVPVKPFENVISKLVEWLEGHETGNDPMGRLFSQEDQTNGIIQATAVAIELACFCLPETNDDIFQREVDLWKIWLKRFCYLPSEKFAKLLIARVSLTRFPSVAYLTAVGAFETDDANFMEAIYSCKLFLLHPNSTVTSLDIPRETNLDSVACRRFLSRINIWKTSEFPVSMLDAVLKITGNRRYNAFLKHILLGMRSAGDAWIEMTLLGKAILSRKQSSSTIEEALKAAQGVIGE